MLNQGPILNALDLKNGATVKNNGSNMYTHATQPLQFLPSSEKDYKWIAWNADYIEMQGLKQVEFQSQHMLKNLRLRYGKIDNRDYQVCEENEYEDLFTLTADPSTDNDLQQLQFFPIIPTVIDYLRGKFIEINIKGVWKTVDEYSQNQMFKEKQEMIGQSLIQQEQLKLLQELIAQGASFTDEEKQKLSPENIRTLPEIQKFFDETYQNILEEWASHLHIADKQRFYLDELEAEQFDTLLTLDKEYWHFKLGENDYGIEIWDPILTAISKSSNTRYPQDANWIVNFDMLTIADVIDSYGWKMTAEQLESLEKWYPSSGNSFLISGNHPEELYNSGLTWKENTEMPSLDYRQTVAKRANGFDYRGRVTDKIRSLTADQNIALDLHNPNKIRVSTIYWKTQTKLVHLTKITEGQPVLDTFVPEDYKILEEPIYDFTYTKEKTRDNLIYGEHIEDVWTNETYGVIKIGPNRPASYDNGLQSIQPIYIGVNGNKPGRLNYQFRGENSIYGCKLPVAGWCGSNKYIFDNNIVRKMAPYQIGFNLVMNQAIDTFISEIGTALVVDQNILPKNALGEEWGKGNVEKSYVTMKNFNILPIDTTLQNTEGGVSMVQQPVVNLAQTNKLQTRIQYAQFYKNMAYEAIGVNLQKLVGDGVQTTAKGEQINADISYSTTSIYFSRHCDYIMKRFHEMRTDLAKYYLATQPSMRLQYITNDEQKVSISYEGKIEYLNNDLNIFYSTSINDTQHLNEIKQLALQNTSEAPMIDRARVLSSLSIAEINKILKESERKMQELQQQQYQREQELEQQRQQGLQQLEQQKHANIMEIEKEKTQRSIYVAEIRAAGYGAQKDFNDNNQNDYMDYMDQLNADTQFQQKLQLETQKENNKQTQFMMNHNLQQQKINAENNRAKIDLKISNNTHKKK